MKKIGIFLAIALSIGMCVSCKNPKPVGEAVKKFAKKYRAASKSDALRDLKFKHRFEKAQELYDNYTSSSPCGTCNGYGVVYQVDSYGNVITDYDGNTIFYFCPSCGGSGSN